MNFLDIQSWWEIPCISHFCSLFSNAFALPEFDIEVRIFGFVVHGGHSCASFSIVFAQFQDLEEALLADGTDEIPGLLPVLIVRLLRGCNRNYANNITTSNYQMFLRRLFRRKCQVGVTCPYKALLCVIARSHRPPNIDLQNCMSPRARIFVATQLITRQNFRKTARAMTQ